MWLSEVHIVVFVPCGSQHFVQWQEKFHELHHGFFYVHCHGCKRWIPIGSMGCVHTHWKRLIIEGCGSSSHV